MPLVSRDQHWIGKEVLRVVFSCPRKILSDAAEGASCAVADEWNDEPERAASLCNRIVRRLKGTLIESSEFWFDAQHATNGVAQSLSPYDLATHFGRSRERVVDFKVRWISRSHGIVWTVSL